MPDKVRFMCAAEQLNTTRSGTKDKWHTSPTPKPLVQFGKVTVVNRGACIEYKGLGYGSTAMSSGFEEYRACPIAAGPLHEVDFLRRAS